MTAPEPASHGGIFISYRRDDAAYPAGWLFDQLSDHFGEGRVFRDIDSIDLGDDFVARITAEVESCAVLLAMIGKEWLTIADDQGHRRLDDPHDFVRLEIEAAITRHVRIIPVLVAGARMPRTDQLPASLAVLTTRQALVLTPDRFKSDTSHLLKVLDRVLMEEPGSGPLPRIGGPEAGEPGTSGPWWPEPARDQAGQPGIPDRSHPARGRRWGLAAALLTVLVAGLTLGVHRSRLGSAAEIAGLASLVPAVLILIGWALRKAEPSSPRRLANPASKPGAARRIMLPVAAVGLPAVVIVALVIAAATKPPLLVARPHRHPVKVSPWTRGTRASVDSSPVVIDGLVYVADDKGFVYALNAANGHVRWTRATGGLIDSRPAVTDGTVYIGNDASKFYALDAATGKIRWVRTVSGGVDSNPAVAGGLVYFGDGNNNIDALSAATGRTRWTYATGRTVQSGPLVVAGVVYVGSEDHKVYALDAGSGAIRWTRRTGGAIDSSPAIARGIVYIGSDDHKIYALNAATGAIRWTRPTGGAIQSSPAIAHGIVYIGSGDHKIYALNAATGAIRWARPTGGAVNSSPAVTDGTVYVGSGDGKVYALNAASGVVRWAVQTNGVVNSSPDVVNGAVYVGTDDNKVLALNADNGS